MGDGKKGKRKPKRGQQKPGVYYLMLGVITVLLLFIVAFLEFRDYSRVREAGGADETVISEKTPEDENYNKSTDEDTETVIYPETVEPGDDSIDKPPVESTGSDKGVLTDKPEPLKSVSLVFVIDDVGNSLEQLDKFLKVPGPLVFAVMPNRRYTGESIRRIKAAGKMAIVHQPMEPVGNADPGKGAIFVGMEEGEIIDILDDNFATTGKVDGMNNHMGSKVTTDKETMRVVMKYLKTREMFFLDSVTNTNLVGSEIAREIGIPYLKRNSMFLDNESDRESILSAIKEGKKTAEKNGHAVMIGHVMTDHLAELLMELYPTFMEDGFTVKDLSELLHGEYDVSAWD